MSGKNKTLREDAAGVRAGETNADAGTAPGDTARDAQAAAAEPEQSSVSVTATTPADTGRQDVEGGATGTGAETDAGVAEAGPEPPVEGSEIEMLRVELEKTKAELEGYREEMLRARAEVENIRKRAQRDVEAAHRYGLERFIGEFLAVKDSIDLGHAAAQEAADVESLREGIDLTLKMFDTALEKVGVRDLNPAGEKFDPEFHEAMTVEESAEAESGTVLRVVQKGYTLNGRLIRPALVIVAKPVERSDAADA